MYIRKFCQRSLLVITIYLRTSLFYSEVCVHHRVYHTPWFVDVDQARAGKRRQRRRCVKPLNWRAQRNLIEKTTARWIAEWTIVNKCSLYECLKRREPITHKLQRACKPQPRTLTSESIISSRGSLYSGLWSPSK